MLSNGLKAYSSQSMYHPNVISVVAYRKPDNSVDKAKENNIVQSFIFTFFFFFLLFGLFLVRGK